jgi:hypothetical protein
MLYNSMKTNIVSKNIWNKVITKLPNSEQSYKGKVKTHKYINRQNQSTTGKLWKSVFWVVFHTKTYLSHDPWNGIIFIDAIKYIRRGGSWYMYFSIWVSAMR